jgi:hypothetical protein
MSNEHYPAHPTRRIEPRIERRIGPRPERELTASDHPSGGIGDGVG